jgi:hypothetical protein
MGERLGICSQMDSCLLRVPRKTTGNNVSEQSEKKLSPLMRERENLNGISDEDVVDMEARVTVVEDEGPVNR